MKKILLLSLLTFLLFSCSDDKKNNIVWNELSNPNQNNTKDSYKASRIDFEKDLNTILEK